MLKNQVLKILFLYTIGIVFANYFQIHWIISLFLWFFLVGILLIITSIGSSKIHFRPWISINILLIFFVSGIVNFNINQSNSFRNNFSTKHLKNDILIGEIDEFNDGKGNYDQAIIEIKQLVRPYDSIVNVRGRLLCYIKKGERQFEEGDIVKFNSSFFPITNNNNPGEFNAERFWKIKGIEYTSFIDNKAIEIIDRKTTFKGFWNQSRNYLKSVIQKHISEENQGLVIALVLGDKSNLSLANKEAFANAGAMHVLAVSGMHVGILLAFLEFIFGKFKFLRKRNTYLYCSILLLWAYAFLTGLPSSVFRAVLMFSILGFGQILGKRLFSLQSVFSSALIILFINPLLLYDIGFQLSYLAVIGIGLFYRPILNLYHAKSKIVTKLWEGTAISFAAQIGTIPLSLYYFNQFPNYFLLSNVVVILLASVAMIGAVVFLLFHIVPYLSVLLAFTVDSIFGVFRYLIEWINTLPGVISSGFKPIILIILLLYISIIITLYYWNKRQLTPVYISISSIFILSLFLLIGREINKNKNEVVVLNHQEEIILIKEDRNLYVFHNKNAKLDDTSLRYLLHGYEVQNGITASYIYPLDKGNSIQNDNLNLIKKRSGLELKYKNKTLFLPNNQFIANNTTDERIIVSGRWNKKDKILNEDFSTREKALILKNNFFE